MGDYLAITNNSRLTANSHHGVTRIQQLAHSHVRIAVWMPTGTQHNHGFRNRGVHICKVLLRKNEIPAIVLQQMEDGLIH